MDDSAALTASSANTVPSGPQQSINKVGDAFDAATRAQNAPPPEVKEAPKAPEKAPEKPVTKAPEKPTDKAPVKPPLKPDTNGHQKATPEDQQRNFAALKDKATKWEEWEKKGKLDLEKELNELRTLKDMTAKERAEREAEKKQYLDELTEHRTWRSAIDLENTDEWKNHVVKPLETLMQSTDKLADKFQIDGNKLWDIINEADPIDREEQLDTLLEGHERRHIVENLARNYANKADAIRTDALGRREHSKGLVNQIQARKAQTEQAQKSEYGKAREENWNFLKEQAPEIFDAEDPEVQEFVKNASEADFHDTPMERALASRLPHLFSAAVGTLRKEREVHAAEIQKLNETIEEISGTRPGGLGRPQELPNTSRKLNANDAFDAAVGQARANGYVR